MLGSRLFANRSLTARLTLLLSVGMLFFLLFFSIFIYINNYRLMYRHEQQLLNDKTKSIYHAITDDLKGKRSVRLSDINQIFANHVDKHQSIQLVDTADRIVIAVDGGNWRQHGTAQPDLLSVNSESFSLPGFSTPVHVRILEDTRERLDPYFRIQLATLLPASGVILLTSTVSIHALTRVGLKPLTRFIEHIHSMNEVHQFNPIPAYTRAKEIEELIAAFNTLLERVEEAITKQNQFIADASHEFRTPLTIIKGYIRLLHRWGKDNAEVREEALTAIEHECARLFRLIDDLLALAKLQNASSHVMKRETQSLVPLLKEVNQAWSTVFPPGLTLTVEWEEPLVAAIDREKIRQLLDIVLDNARKYTKQGLVAVTAHAAGEWIHLKVRDTGIGIPRDKLPHIFERFYRVERSRNRGQGGSGLGLAIARSIVSAHGGKIEIAAAPQGGTEVRIKLPRSLQTAQPVPAPSSAGTEP